MHEVVHQHGPVCWQLKLLEENLLQHFMEHIVLTT